jgi:FMN phosphatase YigB (HAD superfamily)
MDGRVIDIVIFDIGGVLVDPGGVDPMKALAHIGSDDELWTRWLSCPWVAAFESGRCSPEEFATGVVADWQLDISPNEFLASFCSWPGEPYTGAKELLADVQHEVPTGCLSNMNALQWDMHFSRFSMLHQFDFPFLSFELGLVKPDPEIFELVVAQLPALAPRVLFLDDNTINVDAASACGFTAVRTQGVEEARQVLVDAGVLTPS